MGAKYSTQTILPALAWIKVGFKEGGRQALLRGQFVPSPRHSHERGCRCHRRHDRVPAARVLLEVHRWRADRLVPKPAHHWPPHWRGDREKDARDLRGSHQLLRRRHRGPGGHQRQEGLRGGLLEGSPGRSGQERRHLLLRRGDRLAIGSGANTPIHYIFILGPVTPLSTFLPMSA